MTTSWQYKVIDSKDIEGARRLRAPSPQDAESFLNEIGAEGWEIINLDWRELEGRMSFTGVAKRRWPDAWARPAET